MTRAVLSLGANLGDPRAQLAAALTALDADPALAVTAVSHAYETAPIGRTDQPPFVNVSALVETALPASDLLARTQAVEDALGRVRVERWGPRTVDIDVIAFGDLRQDDPALTLPHPRAHERAFVLIPWLELDADARLPGFGPVDALAAALPDQDVRRAGRLEGWS